MLAEGALALHSGWAGWIRALADRLLAADPAAEAYASERNVDGGATTAGGQPDSGDFVAQAYETFQREIHSFVLHATRDAEAAADITRDAYLRLFREAARVRTPVQQSVGPRVALT
jgi:hypothetical protein